MNLFRKHIAPVLGVLVLAVGAVPLAHAGCGMYRHPASVSLGPRYLMPSPYLHRAAYAEDNDSQSEHTIVGVWKEHWISYGSQGIPDGTEVDAGYAMWHSDGTEENISGLRAPLTGDVCFGVWEKVGSREYRMNHFGISYNSTGQNLVGVARIQQRLTLDPKGMATSGSFIIDQYDEAGNLLAHVQGKISGTRVTIDTGFEKVE